MSDNSNDLGAFLAGFVIGGLVGAATALILAPQSGEETRSQIASKSSSLRDTGSERVQRYRDMAESALSDTRSRVQDAGGRVQEQARIVLDSGREQAAKVRSLGGQPTDETEASDTESTSTSGSS